MKRLSLLFLLALILSCGKKESGESGKQETVAQVENSTVVEKISLNDVLAETPGKVLSARSKIVVTFNEDLVESSQVNSTVSGSPFTFEPAVKGTAKWIGRRSLQFTPSSVMKAGTKYSVTLHGSTLLGAQKCSDSVSFSFTAAPQEVIGFEYSFVPIEGKKNRVRLKATLELAERVDTAAVKKDISLKAKSAVPFSVDYGKSQRFIEITSEELERMEVAQTFNVKLPKKYTADQSEWEQNITLPAGTTFEVLYHSDNSDPDHGLISYAFTFSDPIRTDMDLSGFVSVSPSVDYQVTVRGKQLLLEGSFDGGVTYKVTIAKGLTSSYGTKTIQNQSYRMILENRKPQIEWLSDGVLMPDENQSKLQFKTINIKKVNVTIHEVYSDNFGFFLQKNGLNSIKNNSDYDDYYYYDNNSGYQDLERVGEVVYRDTLTIDTVKNVWVKSELLLESLFKKNPGSAYVVNFSFDRTMLTGKPVSSRNNFAPGMLYYSDDGYYTNPAEYGYYYRNGEVSKLLIHSNVGLTVKEESRGLLVSAVNVAKARPEAGMAIGVYNYQNRKIAEGKTDNSGFVQLTIDSGQTPHYLLGDGRSGRAILRMNDGSWNLSTFDVGGSSVKSDGTELFLYPDRGVHRPGDTIFLSGILRLNRQLPPASQPVSITVTNAMGNVAFTEDVKAGDLGHFSWKIATKSSDPTGNWNAKVAVGSKNFYYNLPVEMVKPNRLKVEHSIPAVSNNDTISGDITTRYLFGTPAAGLRAEVFATVRSANFHAKGYSDYTFASPMKKYDNRWLTLYEGSLDSVGNCSFKKRVEGAKKAPALLRGELSLRVHEKGGSTVEKRFTTTLSPYSNYVGVKDPFKWGSALIGEKHDVPVVAVDRKGKPVAGRKLRVRLYINKRYWWWHYDRRNQRDFRSMEQTYRIMDKEVISGSNGVDIPLTIEDYGQHYIEITDLESGHETGFFFWGSRWASGSKTGRGEETYLPVEIDKNVYNPGDIAEISCSAPDSAMAILTIEQDRKILHREWAPAVNGQVKFSVPVTDEMLPNCYAAVQLVQAHNQTSNDMPQSIFGIKPIRVEDAATRLPVTIKSPETIRPEEQFEITLGNKSNEAVSATIAIVDEGLLDLTDFKTPNPWNHFFRKLQLAVQSRDNFGKFLGALLPDMKHFFSVGGDAEEEAREDRVGDTEAKRFKPVVLFEQPIEIRGGSDTTVTFTMPNYVGEVRVMVVAAGTNSFASIGKQIPVKQPLMILPTLPRTIRPGDKFDLPVSVFALDSTIKDATISVTSSGGISFKKSKQSVTFSSNGEEDITFTASAGKRVGVDTVTVTAVSGNESTTVTVELPMQSANPFYTEVTESIVGAKSEVTMKAAPFGYEGTNRAKLTLTRTPDIQLEKRAQYLIRYPYGCIEQTTSSAMPQLVLDQLLDLSDARKRMLTDNVNGGIKRLRLFEDGSIFTYWPRSRYYGSYSLDWGGLYASHFLILAQKQGYVVPKSQQKHMRTFVKDQAKRVRSNGYLHQSYALFLLALDGNANLGKMNLLKENHLSKMNPLSQELLATAYFIAGKTNVAAELTKHSVEVTKERSLSGTFASPARDHALYTYLASIRGESAQAAKMMKHLSDQFKPGRWYSTHETGLAILAVAEFNKAFGKQGDHVEYEVTIGKKKIDGTLHLLNRDFDIENLSEPIVVKNKSGAPLYAALSVSGVPMDDRIKTEAKGLQLTRKLYNEKGQQIGLNELKQGDPAWVVFKVKSSWSTSLKEIALTMVLPAGWEIVNTRLTGEKYPSWIGYVSNPTYSDIRDDRINWFFNLNQYGSQTYAVKIVPTFAGEYTLPPVVMETMYSPDYYARIQGDKTTVTKQ